MRRENTTRALAFVASIALTASTAPAHAGDWTSVEPMNKRRALHTMTPLVDGRVLVAGGIETYVELSGSNVTSAETFNAMSGKWTKVGDMADPRFEHCAVRLKNGRVLVAGGASLGTATVTAEIFDPDTNVWTPATSMNAGRYWCTATLLDDGRVLIAGGLDGGAAVATTELYDPDHNTWVPDTETPTLNIARGMHTATLLDDGRVLIVGGTLKYDGSGARDTAEIFDPVKGTWSLAGSMSQGRSLHTATLLQDGRVLIAGGMANDGPFVVHKSVEIFDPNTGTWALGASMHGAHSGHAASLLGNGRVLVAGGDSSLSDTAPAVLTSAAELYDPVANAWIDATPMAGARNFFGASILLDGRVLVSGGSDPFSSGPVQNAAEIYFPSTGTLCAASTDCPSGFCVDGICCDAACDAECQACTRAAGATFDGACEDLPRNTAGACTPECVFEHDCQAPMPCADAAECPSGFCVDGFCCGTACDGQCDVCSRAAGAADDGTCTSLPRDDAGACTRACVSAHDCPSPKVCNTQGICVSPPPVVSDFSGCRAGSRAPDDAPWWPASVLLAAWMGRVVRRRARKSV